MRGLPKGEGTLFRGDVEAQKDVVRYKLHFQEVAVEERLRDRPDGVGAQHVHGANEEDVVNVAGAKDHARGISRNEMGRL